MKPINKIDYFVGVFVTSILASAKSVPALFDETVRSKKVEFTTDTNEFNVYVKYSTNKLSTARKGKQKKKTYWNFPFTSAEYDKLNNFPKEGYDNCIALVCTDRTYSKTWIAVLDFEKAMKCLRNAAPNGSRRITVIRYGNAQEFTCMGVGYQDDDYESCAFDFTTYFEKAKLRVAEAA